MRKPGCLRAFVCACPACPRRVSALRSCRSPAFPRFPCCAHTWLRPHVTVWALLVFARVVEEQACCGRVCLRVAGVRVYARGVFAWGVCASWCWRLLGVAGAVWLRPPLCPGLLACVLTLWCGLVGVCAAGACGVGAWAVRLGRDNRVPPHTVWRAVPGCCVRGEGEKGWG